ncbi:hypothetical protein S40288_09149 [Stachybotrys chartarum IBT 40288]|nr:hypothetical protein S40288_09149 [Stachybotrys chartarum IBT 40288]
MSYSPTVVVPSIHLAVKNRKEGMVSKRLEYGADPNLCDLAGTTPTMLSARSGQADILHLLLSKDVNVFQKDLHKRDALYWACLSGSSEAIRQIVAKMRGSSEWRVCCSAALHHVLAAEDPMELFDALLGDEDEESGSDIVAMSEPDRNGWTLAYAMEHGRSQSLLKLPIWFKDAIKRSQDNALLPQSPTGWDTKDRPFSLEVSEDGQTVAVGPGTLPNVEQSLIHSDFCIPADQDYYFEITMAAPPERSEPPEGPFEIGIGLCVENTASHLMVGWETGSIGLHGDDGRTYAQVGWGRPYSDAFDIDHTIGCRIQVKDGNRTVSFVKNKRSLSVAFEDHDIPCGQLYPAISIDAKLSGFSISGRFGSSVEGELSLGPRTPDSKNRELGQATASSIGVTRRESSGANKEDEDRDDGSDFSW